MSVLAWALVCDTMSVVMNTPAKIASLAANGGIPAESVRQDTKLILVIEPQTEDGLAMAICPNCGRRDTLVVLGDFTACAACGYSSEGVRGCT